MLKTLYVHRPLVLWCAEDVLRWAKQQGFEDIVDPPDMHVTIAFSKKEVEWDKFTPSLSNIMDDTGDEVRSLTILGESAVVLKFESDILQGRWKTFIEGGCSFDWDTYQPHVTISYAGTKLDLTKIKPYRWSLVFGPEVFKEVDPKWVMKTQ